MQNLLLFGKNGQLGWELQRSLAMLGKVIAVDFPEIDLTKPKNLRDFIRQQAPHIIINAAAYTNVDKAEDESALAWTVNAEAPGVMAEEARRLNAAVIHYSTDYVFNGKKGSPYVETDSPDPLNVYGKSKLGGEQAVTAAGEAFVILRTSWVYSLRQGGFVTKVLQWTRQQETLRIVDDQIGSPTWARMLAEATAQVLARGRDEPVEYLRQNAGLYHLAGSGSASRFEWAEAILDMDSRKEEQKVKQLLPAKTSEFTTAAVRPENSGLDVSRFEAAFGMSIPKWMESLRLMLAD